MKWRHVSRLLLVFGVGLANAACRSQDPATFDRYSVAGGEPILKTAHRGPSVVPGDQGPARFTSTLRDTFSMDEAGEMLAFIDGFYRAPGNDGYEAVMQRLEQELRQAGFGSLDGFELEWIETPLTAPAWGDRETREAAPAWTPLSARLALTESNGRSQVLQSFDAASDPHRTMLPVNAPAALVSGRVCFELDRVTAGAILVTKAAPRRSVLQRAVTLGAVAVLSANLEPYNADPSGQNREREAIQYRIVPQGIPLAVAMISPRTYESIETTVLTDPESRLTLECKVKLDSRPLRTLTATVRGSDRPEEAFAIASHVQEPGANDNATGVVGLLASARGLAQAIRDGRIERPSRSVVFLWGDEFRQTSTWLESTKLRPIGGLSSDMTGASRERTGAICLLERKPDPGAMRALPPDEHTPWGQTEVSGDSLEPDGMSIIARCALADVAQLEPGWETGEHPYEGGSDHDIFIQRHLPTALFWHFTDFTYHTSLDRMDMVDLAEVRRSAVAILATALCMADPRPGDLDRYLHCLNQERAVRLAAAEQAGDEELGARWLEWFDGARQWLRVECLRIPESER